MEDPTPDFPPLISRQRDLLEAIKHWKGKLRSLGAHAPEDREIIIMLQEQIEKFTIKALRPDFGLFKRFPDGGFRLFFKDADDGTTSVSVFPGYFHPELPSWAVNHFSVWIMNKQCIRGYGLEDILPDAKAGLEKRVRRPKSWNLLETVLSFRGHDITSEKVWEYLWTKPWEIKEPKQERLRKLIKKERNPWKRIALQIKESKRGRPRKRVRKEGNSWDWTSSQLVKKK